MADCKAWLASQGSGSTESKSCQPRIEIAGLKGSENDLNGLYTFSMDNGKVQKNEEHPIYKQRVSFKICSSIKTKIYIRIKMPKFKATISFEIFARRKRLLKKLCQGLETDLLYLSKISVRV